MKNVSLEELQMRSDIISFHVPYTDETHHYCNLKFLKNCLKTPIIINTSRGAIINTVDMLTALAQHQVAGICIDVFEDEPLTKNKIHPVGIYQQLIANDNVIATLILQVGQ